MKHLLALAAAAALLLGACRVKGAEDLAPGEKDFLSVVRYIITKQERKQFLALTPAERPAFIARFWKERDPNPETENNEYRDEYYARIDQANRLFLEGSRGSGWLTDRGRVYILLGPPERRDIYPTGYSFYEPPVEVWYYGSFPIIFVDSYREGAYRLDPGSARHLSMINVAQMSLKPGGILKAEGALDFRVAIVTTKEGSRELQLLVPYRLLKLADGADGTRQAPLKVTLEIRPLGKDKAPVVNEQREFLVAVTPAMLDTLPEEFAARWPLQLAPGSYTAVAVIDNTVDNSRAAKKINFSL